MNFGDDSIVECDVQNVNLNSIPKFDVLVAGFPSQKFSSVVLKRGLMTPRGNLFFETARFINYIKPKAIFFENVSNIVKHNNGNTLKTICNTLEELGYYYTFKIMNAFDYDILQQRNRLYSVSFLEKDKSDTFRFPKERELKKTAFAFFEKEKQPDSYYMNNNKRY